MVRLKTIAEWREVVENPPRCCVNCEHYTHAIWSEKETCKVHEASPPREYAEAESDCPSWTEMMPF
jgi:hypothetical protein